MLVGCSSDDPNPNGDTTMDVNNDADPGDADEACVGVTYRNSNGELCPERRITCYPGTIDCEPLTGESAVGDVICFCNLRGDGFWSWRCSTGCRPARDEHLANVGGRARDIIVPRTAQDTPVGTITLGGVQVDGETLSLNGWMDDLLLMRGGFRLPGSFE